MNQPPLNPDALGRMFATAMMEVLDAEKLQPGDRLVHVNDVQEVLNRLEKNILAAALPEVTSSEDIRILIGDVQTAMDHEHLDPREFFNLSDVLWALKAQVQPEVTSVEQWDALPIGTMVRVHFNGNSELIIRCPAGSGAGIGGMSFVGGRWWTEVFTVWNADKLEIKYIPEVKPCARTFG